MDIIMAKTSLGLNFAQMNDQNHTATIKIANSPKDVFQTHQRCFKMMDKRF